MWWPYVGPAAAAAIFAAVGFLLKRAITKMDENADLRQALVTQRLDQLSGAINATAGTLATALTHNQQVETRVSYLEGVIESRLGPLPRRRTGDPQPT